MGREVPGQTGMGRPVVPLSRDKGKSKCPGTNSSVLGHPVTKSLSQKNIKNRKRMSKNSKSGHFFEILKFILSRDVPGQRVLSRDICSCPCPGTKGQRDRQNFFVPGQRDNGTGKLFCPGTKGQRDVPSRFVPGRPAGRPVPWKHYYRLNMYSKIGN